MIWDRKICPSCPERNDCSMHHRDLCSAYNRDLYSAYNREKNASRSRSCTIDTQDYSDRQLAARIRDYDRGMKQAETNMFNYLHKGNNGY